MPADSIIVTVEIAAAVDTVTTTLDEPFKAPEFERQLGDDYMTLLNDDVLTDFTIRVSDRDVRTHKAILAARSPVFAAMFTHSDTKESKMGVLTIEDLDYEVVRDMLMYIYSGKCSARSDWATELLIAADKYRLDELKRHCEATMIRELTCDNVCQQFVMGHMYNADKLKQRSADFMKLHLTAITKTSGWDELINKHPSLVTSIVRYVDNRKSWTACDDVSNSNVL
uniref:BTB domain-containing protein n=1 Tax=Steinernema glaseri TaxID=37863 RepID=A0A1I7ZED2_9BILA